MLRSIPGMGHVGLLLSLVLYIYAVLGVHLQRGVDPEHWATLGAGLLTLFQMMTLEGWVDVMDRVRPTHPWAWVYFASFILLAVYVVVNMLVAVVVSNLDDVRAEERRGVDGGGGGGR